MLNVERLEARVVAAMAEARVPGAALGIVDGGAVTNARGFGVASAEEDRPVTAETLFQIGSTTKPLTGTMVMTLVDEGVLDLDTPVRRWLPELRFSEPGAAERVTLRMLLSHTAGLPWDQITPTRLHGSRDPDALAIWTRDELPTRSLVAPPGTRHSYSNPGLNLAARVAEAATGRHYADLMRERLFEPAGMARTTLDPLVAMTFPHAQAHELSEDGAPRVFHRAADNVAQYPSAFVWSNVTDLLRFALLHLGDGTLDGTRVLTPESLAAMNTPETARDESGDHYGLTFVLDSFDGVARSSHPGGINNFGCQFALLRERGQAVVILVNQLRGFPAAEIADEIFTELAGR